MAGEILGPDRSPSRRLGRRTRRPRTSEAQPGGREKMAVRQDIGKAPAFSRGPNEAKRHVSRRMGLAWRAGNLAFLGGERAGLRLPPSWQRQRRLPSYGLPGDRAAMCASSWATATGANWRPGRTGDWSELATGAHSRQGRTTTLVRGATRHVGCFPEILHDGISCLARNGREVALGLNAG
jgi:hypothetical protein